MQTTLLHEHELPAGEQASKREGVGRTFGRPEREGANKTKKQFGIEKRGRLID